MKTMNPITCVGDRLNLLEYSSLKRISPPNPAGMLIFWSAMIYEEGDSF